MHFELLIEGLPPGLNHATKSMYNKKLKRVVHYKAEELKEWQRIVEKACKSQHWPFAPKQPLRVELVFFFPKVLTKQGELSMNAGDTDGFLKHSLDAVFRVYSYTAKDAQIVTFEEPRKIPSDELKGTLIRITGLDLVTWRETALKEGRELEARLREKLKDGNRTAHMQFGIDAS